MPDRVGGVADRHQCGVLGERRLQIGQVEGAVFEVDVDPAHPAAAVLGDAQPGGDVAVVVEAGDDQGVAGVEGEGEGAGEGEGEGGHVGAKDDLFRAGGVEELRHRRAGLVQDGIRLLPGGKSPAVVGVGVEQVIVHPVQAVAGDLGAARVVEEDVRLGQRRELGTDSIQIQRHRLLLTGNKV